MKKNVLNDLFKKTGRYLTTIFLIFITLLFLKSFVNISYMDPIETAFADLDFYDIYFSKLKETTIQDNIVIVNIGFLDREGISNELDVINKFNPKAVGIVANFKFKDSLFDNKTQLLLNSMNNTKNLFLSFNYFFDDDINYCRDIKKKYKRLVPKAKIGFGTFSVNNQNSSFRTIRDFTPSISIPDTFFSFATELCRTIKPDAVKILMERDNLEEVINYAGNFIDNSINSDLNVEVARLKKYSGFKVIDESEIFNENFDSTIFKDKIVLLGYLGLTYKGTIKTTEDDIFYTPQNDRYLGRSFPDMNNVLIQANIINMILNEKFINKAGGFPNLLLLIFFTICMIYLCKKIKSVQSLDIYYALISKLAAFIFAATIYIIFLIIVKSSGIMFNMSPIFLFLALTPDIVDIHNSLSESKWIKRILLKAGKEKKQVIIP